MISPKQPAGRVSLIRQPKRTVIPIFPSAQDGLRGAWSVKDIRKINCRPDLDFLPGCPSCLTLLVL